MELYIRIKKKKKRREKRNRDKNVGFYVKHGVSCYPIIIRGKSYLPILEL